MSTETVTCTGISDADYAAMPPAKELCSQDRVMPSAYLGQTWRATVLRTEDGKALLDITEIWLHGDDWRKLYPPIRAWVPVEGLAPIPPEGSLLPG